MTGAPTKPSEILSAAADLIEPQGRWTQGVYGRRAGKQVAIEHLAMADCFCTAGATLRITEGRSDRRVEEALLKIGRRGGYSNIADWNDDPDRTQAEVVSALRQASEKAREAGE